VDDKPNSSRAPWPRLPPRNDIASGHSRLPICWSRGRAPTPHLYRDVAPSSATRCAARCRPAASRLAAPRSRHMSTSQWADSVLDLPKRSHEPYPGLALRSGMHHETWIRFVTLITSHGCHLRIHRARRRSPPWNPYALVPPRTRPCSPASHPQMRPLSLPGYPPPDGTRFGLVSPAPGDRHQPGFTPTRFTTPPPLAPPVSP